MACDVFKAGTAQGGVFVITSPPKMHLDTNLQNSLQESPEYLHSDLLIPWSSGTISLATAMAAFGWQLLKSAAPSSAKPHHQKQLLLFWTSPGLPSEIFTSSYSHMRVGMHTLAHAHMHTQIHTHTLFSRHRELRETLSLSPICLHQMRPVKFGVLGRAYSCR